MFLLRFVAATIFLTLSIYLLMVTIFALFIGILWLDILPQDYRTHWSALAALSFVFMYALATPISLWFGLKSRPALVAAILVQMIFAATTQISDFVPVFIRRDLATLFANDDGVVHGHELLF